MAIDFNKYAEEAETGLSVKHVFPTTMYQIHLQNNDWFKDVYLDKIKSTYGVMNLKPRQWLTNKIHTSFGSASANDVVFGSAFPYQKYFDAINKIFDGAWGGDITDYWFNLYTDGEWQEKHSHISETGYINPQFSCIHFMQFDPVKHRAPIFCDPSASLKASSINIAKWSTSSAMESFVNEGDLLVFPSYMEHFVPPSEPTPDYPRITISFNVQIKSYAAPTNIVASQNLFSIEERC